MRPDEINRFLADFVASPADTMDRVPDKLGPDGRARDDAETAFDDEALVTGDFVEQRDVVRAAIYAEDEAGNAYSVADLAAGKAPIQGRDRAPDLVDEMRHDKPSDVDAAGLGKSALPETPWSDDYWAHYLGILGRRYADEAFPASDDWKENHAYVTERPAAKIVASRDQDAIDALSPSEKYDLLVGDATFGLTSTMWADGKKYYDQSGRVELWMGICHGWAPASYMLARPRHVVTVTSPEGVAIRFFPADIKALASLLWANSSPASRFIGTRCEEKDPPKDENGRALSAAAFDNNPGTFYLAMVNQVGVSRRSMILDATYDYEVWNQPICAYETHYFHPEDMRFAATAREGTVSRGSFKRDRFAKYRTRDYAAVVGVAMRTRYVVETPPSHAPTDAPANDATRLVDYYFDLELDRAGRVVGGEWYMNRHPDFLWTPARGQRAVTPADGFASGAWHDGPVPVSWRGPAARASAEGLPLAKIVERLIALATA